MVRFLSGGNGVYCSSQLQACSGPHPVGPGGFSPRVRRLKCRPNHSSSFGGGVRNVWSCTSMPPYVFQRGAKEEGPFCVERGKIVATDRRSKPETPKYPAMLPTSTVTSDWCCCIMQMKWAAHVVWCCKKCIHSLKECHPRCACRNYIC